jgi:hypothetical protein
MVNDMALAFVTIVPNALLLYILYSEYMETKKLSVSSKNI